MSSVYVTAIGCRLNTSEMESLARQLAGQGHTLAVSPTEAELCVLNTCAVTGEAERKSRQAARRLHRENPLARLVVTGCYATLCPADAGRLPGEPRVVSNQAKSQLPGLLGLESPQAQPEWRVQRGRTRAFVKVQDGCDNQCAYCVTKLARGRARSRPLPEVLAEVSALEAAGYHEVVLTGVHLGGYGRDASASPRGAHLGDLVTELLSRTGIRRLRLSSLEPWDLGPKFLALWKDPRLCRQLHLPLQSGSATVLRRMQRQTAPDGYRDLALRALALIPDLALTTDIIVGFPGESVEEFHESVEFIQALEFARLHVFSYSQRPGTAAAQMPGQVPAAIKRRRAKQVRELGRQKEQAFQRRFVGAEVDVLWEALTKKGEYQGLTSNYIRVTTESALPLQNSITKTVLTELRRDGMRGAVIVPLTETASSSHAGPTH